MPWRGSMRAAVANGSEKLATGGMGGTSQVIMAALATLAEASDVETCSTTGQEVAGRCSHSTNIRHDSMTVLHPHFIELSRTLKSVMDPNQGFALLMQLDGHYQVLIEPTPTRLSSNGSRVPRLVSIRTRQASVPAFGSSSKRNASSWATFWS